MLQILNDVNIKKALPAEQATGNTIRVKYSPVSVQKRHPLSEASPNFGVGQQIQILKIANIPPL
jgi:hypothetical protein